MQGEPDLSVLGEAGDGQEALTVIRRDRPDVALLDINLQVSKPMLVDVFTVQSQIDGQTDAKLIADQATATTDMFSSMAVGTQLATLEGDNIVSKLHYANNQVEFNGQKMTVEQFVAFVMSKLGATGELQ